MPSTIPQRVLFEDQRFLQADDLIEEQQYQMFRRWQHNLALHSWGILCGLEVTFREPLNIVRPGITVQPGMALDGYGRELVVTGIIENRDVLDTALTYDVWLLYSAVRAKNEETKLDDSRCGSDTAQLGRMIEEPTIALRRTSQRRSGQVSVPIEVPVENLNYGPHQPPQFGLEAKWPVFLAKLEFREGQWLVDHSERRYGGLIAERIEFPRQQAFAALPPEVAAQNCCDRDNAPVAVQQNAGREATFLPRTVLINGTRPDRPNMCFAVQAENDIEDTKNPSTPLLITRKQVTTNRTQSETKTETEIRLTANRVVAEADFVLQGGAAIEFAEVPLDQRATPSAAPLPKNFGIFRQFLSATKVETTPPPAASSPPPVAIQPQAPNGNDEQVVVAVDANAQQFADVLQFSIPKAGCLNRIEFGATDSEGTFTPILVIQEDETVNIYGTLRVHGPIFGEQTDIPAGDPTREVERLISRIKPIFANVTQQTPKQALVAGFVAAIDADVQHGVDDYATFISKATTASLVKGVEAAETDPRDTLLKSVTTLSVGLLKDGEFAAAVAAQTDGTKLKPAYIQLVSGAIKKLTPAEFVTGVGTTARETLKALVTHTAETLASDQFVTALQQVTIGDNLKNIYALLVTPTINTIDADKFVDGIDAGTPSERNPVYEKLISKQIEALPEVTFVDDLALSARWIPLLTYLWTGILPDGTTPSHPDQRVKDLAKSMPTAKEDLKKFALELKALGNVQALHDALTEFGGAT